MNGTAISCSGISKHFEKRVVPIQRLQDRLIRWRRHGENVRIDALKNISLEMMHGEWLGIYGSNGSGKTTFLKIIAGLIRADRGILKCHGTLSSFFELGIGFHPERNAIENIYLHGLLHGMSAKNIVRFTEKILDFADIGVHPGLPVKCYSTGMKMRLAFAAAAHIEADIYLFDEVLAVGDADFQHKCRSYLKRLRSAGKTVLLVSHNLNNLDEYCDRILYIEKGELSTRPMQTELHGDFAL